MKESEIEKIICDCCCGVNHGNCDENYSCSYLPEALARISKVVLGYINNKVGLQLCKPDNNESVAYAKGWNEAVKSVVNNLRKAGVKG